MPVSSPFLIPSVQVGDTIGVGGFGNPASIVKLLSEVSLAVGIQPNSIGTNLILADEVIKLLASGKVKLYE